MFFKELKVMYRYDQGSDLVLFNNIEIIVDNKSVYLSNCVEKGVTSIKGLLNDHGSCLSFQEFSDKFACKTDFLQYYQIITTIPNQLLLKARQENSVNKELFTSNEHFSYFNNNFGINLDKTKSRDFYQLLLYKTHTATHTGPKRWSEILSLDDDHRDKFFKSLRTICRETKLREFHFKFIHRTVMTEEELFKYGIKLDDECCLWRKRLHRPYLHLLLLH